MDESAKIVCGERERGRGEIERRSLQAAAGLRTLGVGEGSCVALLLRNGFAFFEASFAATALGAYAVPMNWHLAAPEIAHVLEDSAGRVRAWLRERLAGYKVPRLIEFRDELPRQDSGKIYKRELREPYWTGHDRRI